MDKNYEENAYEFIWQIFTHFRDWDYLLLTMPHGTPYFKLLDKFEFIPSKPSSNF